MIKPTKKQYEFLTNRHRYILFNGGLGVGKTFIGAVKTYYNVIKHPGSITAVFAPTYKMLDDATIRTFFSVVPDDSYLYNKSKNIVYFPNGSEVWFRSADNPDSIRGAEIAYVWLDEAAMMAENMFKVADGRLRQKGFKHQMYLTSTPKGMNWIYNKFVLNPTSDFWYITASTMENKYLPEEYVNSLLQNYAGQFKQQELFAEFCSPQGLVFSSYNEQIHKINASNIPLFVNRYAGIDWGFSDPFALVVAGEDIYGNIYLIDEIYASQLHHDEQLKLVSDMYLKYKWSRCWADPSNPSFISSFKSGGIPIEKGDNDVIAGIALVNSYFANNKLKVSDKLTHIPNNILQYRYAEDTDGNRPNEKPLHPYSHSNDAIRYMMMGIERQRKRGTKVSLKNPLFKI